MPQIPWNDHDGNRLGHIVHERTLPDGTVVFLAALDAGGFESGVVR